MPPTGVVGPAHAENPEPPPQQQEVTSTAPEPSTQVTRASEHQPLYKKWRLWTAVGAVAAVGVGVGVGVGVSESHKTVSGTTFPVVTF
jgi:hypothetical protein